jgi:hypothetical protein
MHNISLIMIFVAASLFVSRAECSEWKYLTSTQGNEHYYDVIEEPFKLTDIMLVRQKTIYNEHTVDKIKYMHGYQYRDFTESVHVFAIDCVKKRRQIKAIFHYNSEGIVIDSIDYKDTAAWGVITHGTIPYLLYKKACEGRQEKESKDMLPPVSGKDK